MLTERNMHMYSKVTVKCVSKSNQLYAVKKILNLNSAN